MRIEVSLTMHERAMNNGPRLRQLQTTTGAGAIWLAVRVCVCHSPFNR